jgi:hypothetical protein
MGSNRNTGHAENAQSSGGEKSMTEESTESLDSLTHRAERIILEQLIVRLQAPDLDNRSFCTLSGVYCDVRKQSAAQERVAVAHDAVQIRKNEQVMKNRHAPTPDAPYGLKADGTPYTDEEYHAGIKQAVIDAYGADFYPDYKSPDSGDSEPNVSRSPSGKADPQRPVDLAPAASLKSRTNQVTDGDSHATLIPCSDRRSPRARHGIPQRVISKPSPGKGLTI